MGVTKRCREGVVSSVRTRRISEEPGRHTHPPNFGEHSHEAPPWWNGASQHKSLCSDAHILTGESFHVNSFACSCCISPVTEQVFLRHPGFPFCQDSASSFRLRSWLCLPPPGPQSYPGEYISEPWLELRRGLRHRPLQAISRNN